MQDGEKFVKPSAKVVASTDKALLSDSADRQTEINKLIDLYHEISRKKRYNTMSSGGSDASSSRPSTSGSSSDSECSTSSGNSSDLEEDNIKKTPLKKRPLKSELIEEVIKITQAHKAMKILPATAASGRNVILESNFFPAEKAGPQPKPAASGRNVILESNLSPAPQAHKAIKVLPEIAASGKNVISKSKAIPATKAGPRSKPATQVKNVRRPQVTKNMRAFQKSKKRASSQEISDYNLAKKLQLEEYNLRVRQGTE